MFQIKNGSDLPVAISGYALTGADADQFWVGSNDCPTPLFTGMSCTVSVDFRPTRTGPAGAELEVSHDGATQPLVQPLGGAGVPATLSVNPGSLDFGVVEVNRDQPSYGIWVQNTGGAPVALGPAFIDGPGANAFQIEGNGCGMLGTGQGCNLQVRFRPSDAVDYAAVLHLPSGNGDTPVPLAGTGGIRRITPDVEPLEFGSVDVGDGLNRTVTLRSTGNIPFQSIVVIPNGGDIGSFRVMTDDCSMVVIDPQKTCRLTVRFAPQAPGPAQAAITVIQGDGEPAVIHARGTGLQAAASVSPGGIDFGAQGPGTAGAPRPVTVTNQGTASLRVSGVTVGGTDAGAFTVAGETCTRAPVAPGGSCTVRVRFAPDGTGARSATLGVLTNDAAGIQTVTLTGEGSAAVGPLDTRAASVAFDWLPGLPSPYRAGRVDLGRARCVGATACTVRVQARLSTAGPLARRATATTVWTPGTGSRVSVAIPRSLRRAPTLLVATLRTTAAGRAAGTRIVRIPLVPGRRLGSLVASPPASRQAGPTLRLGSLWCVRGPGACTASAELTGATTSAAGTSQTVEVRALSRFAIRLSPSGAWRLAIRRPANLVGDEVNVLLRTSSGTVRSAIALGVR